MLVPSARMKLDSQVVQMYMPWHHKHLGRRDGQYTQQHYYTRTVWQVIFAGIKSCGLDVQSCISLLVDLICAMWATKHAHT